jgi:MFS family permease
VTIRGAGVDRRSSPESRSAHGSAPVGLDWPLRVALAANFVVRLAGAATGILLTRYLARIDDAVYPVGAATVGALTGAFYATELIGAPLLGALGDRRGWRCPGPFTPSGWQGQYLALLALLSATR